MEDDTNVNGPGLPAIYGASTTSSITRSGWTSVVYHNKKPKWTDEIKIRLPPTLTALNHLLVTFYHVSCRASKKQAEPLTPLGYCAIRLINSGGEIIKDDKYNVPVASVFPPKYFDLENRENLLRWVDNKKGVFSYRTRLVSTIYTQDSNLHSLYHHRSPDPAALFQQLSLVPSIPPRVRVQHMPMLLNILLRVVCEVSKPSYNRNRSGSTVGTPTGPGTKGRSGSVVDGPSGIAEPGNNNMQKEEIAKTNPAVEAMLALIDTVHTIHKEAPGLEYLESYVTYMFSQSRDLKGLYAALVSLWIFLIDEKHDATKDLAKFSWFFFRLISKSMVLELQENGKIQAENTRKGRFLEFTTQLYFLVGQLAGESQRLARISLGLSRSLNLHLAWFLSDLLDIGDRGQVFRLIHLYIRKLDPDNEIMELVEFKFAFLRVLATHDFYIPLNITSPTVIPPVSEIYSTFFKKHFLVGLLLAEVGGCMRARERDMRIKAIFTLRDQLYRHEHDPRFQDPAVKERIAGMYFPFIPLVLDHATTIQKMEPVEARDWLICFVYILKGVGLTVQSEWLKKETPKRKLNLFDILTYCIKVFEYPGREECKHIVATLKHNSTQLYMSPGLEESMSPDPEGRRHSIRKELKSTFFKSRGIRQAHNVSRDSTKQILESYYTNGGLRASSDGGRSTPTGTFTRNTPVGTLSHSPGGTFTSHTLSHYGLRVSVDSGSSTPPLGALSPGSGGSGSVSKRRKHSVAAISNSPQPTSAALPVAVLGAGSDDPLLLAKHYAALATEVSLVVFCALLQFMQDHLADLTRPTNDFIEPIFNALITFLRTSQSQNFLTVFFKTLPEIIEDFKLPLFKYTNTLCGELTYELMGHCQDKLVQNRVAAATCLFLMIHTNNQTMKNILRMKLQTTIAISKLVGEGIDQDFDFIKACLEAVAKHIKAQHAKVQTQQGPMGQQMDELNERLFGVIRDSLKIKSHLYDPEMTTDLYCNISRGFMESPDLRVTWLHSLSNFHKQHNNWEETAETLVMKAALVMEYLKILGRFPVQFPADFQSVFPNIDKELTLPDPALLTSLRDEICLSKVFTEQGFINLIKEAIGMQKLGLLYESSVSTYRLLLPIHQKRRNWVMQAECHSDLAHLCNKIVEDNKASGRIFPNYYRVALYGQENLGSNHGAEFVYKESNATRLADLSDRLTKQFGDKFGADKVHLLPNKPVDVKSLDPTHIYIQIVAVDPYLTSEELKDRISPFEQNFNINKFMFEIPFTKSGKAHGDMAEQYKRKTIIVVEAAFPHMKKRLRIIDKKEIEVPPIENAIELIDKKTVQLGQQLRTAQPNSKTLQILLQGSLLTQVNVGPLEICRVFLSEEAPKNTFSQSEVSRLTEAMKEFAQSLGAAVKLNARLVDSNDNNQLMLQDQLTAGYRAFVAKVGQYVQLELDADL